MTVVLALSYSGRDEIVRMAKRLAREARERRLDPGESTNALVAAHLDSAEVPDPDLLIRTSGEMRISNFYLWQIAYSELYVTPTLWPDFRETEYLQALLAYQRRRRRFGRTDEQVERADASCRQGPMDANLSVRIVTAAVGLTGCWFGLSAGVRLGCFLRRSFSLTLAALREFFAMAFPDFLEKPRVPGSGFSRLSLSLGFRRLRLHTNLLALVRDLASRFLIFSAGR